jgi:hypothetical protein
MSETNAVEIARIKNALFCLWVGSIFGIAALAVTSFWRAVAIVMVVSVSCYLNVGRKTLSILVVPVLLFGLLEMFDVHLTWDGIREAAHQMTASR